jgi:hypothetical protein
VQEKSSFISLTTILSSKSQLFNLTQRFLSKDSKWERQEVCERVGGVSQVGNEVLCVLCCGGER